MERSEIRGRHRRLVAIPDYAPLHPGYVFEPSSKNRILANLFWLLIDFRLRPHRVSKPFCSNVSRQQNRRFNDLQCFTSPHPATAFDNRLRIVF
jgi:hypothetical protein